MHPCTVSQLVSLVDGNSVGGAVCSGSVSGGAIDSRLVQPGEIFFALAGSRTHGILHAAEAIARGASCIVTDAVGEAVRCVREDAAVAADAARGLSATPSSEIRCPLIRVAQTELALQQAARWNRQQSDCLIIGVTGSVGKTTTRQMIAAVLGTTFRGMQSPANFNNELGVPLSLLKLDPAHEFGVLELAARRRGEIRSLAELAQPEFAVVTRVAPAHLESFGDLEEVRRAKQELVESIGAGGTVFLNSDDPAVLAMKEFVKGNVCLLGTGPRAAVRATEVSARNGVCRFTVGTQRFEFHGGRHFVTAALAAIATGRLTGVADAQIAHALRTFRMDAGRGRVVMETPWTVIDDSYNASPASVRGAIEALADWPDARHRVLILGDMLDLGSATESHCLEIGRKIADSEVDHAVLLGAQADTVIRGARAAGDTTNRYSSFRDVRTLLSIIDCLLSPGDVILVKGSRGMKMERIVAALLQPVSADREVQSAA